MLPLGKGSSINDVRHLGRVIHLCSWRRGVCERMVLRNVMSQSPHKVLYFT